MHVAGSYDLVVELLLLPEDGYLIPGSQRRQLPEHRLAGWLNGTSLAWRLGVAPADKDGIALPRQAAQAGVRQREVV